MAGRCLALICDRRADSGKIRLSPRYLIVHTVVAVPYPAEFREHAVRLVMQSERSIRSVSTELHISPNTLRRWVGLHRELTVGSGSDSSAGDSTDTAAVGVPPGSGTAEHLVIPAALDTAPQVLTPSRHVRGWRWLPVSAYLAVTACWALAVSLSSLLHPPGMLQRAAVSAHVVSVVVGFGAVLLVDWHALLWLRGRRSLHDCIRVAAAARPIIWLGTAGLLISGALLQPDLTDPVIWAKLVAVLLILVNGVAVSGVAARLEAAKGAGITSDQPPPRVLRRMLAAGALSAAAWWAAIIIGLMTDAHRH
jgi:transposase-like protein